MDIGRDHRLRELRSLLVGYRACDAAERHIRTRMLQLVDETPEPLSRNQFLPGHFTASAFVISASLARALLVDHPRLNRWLQPGGHIEDHDQSPADAATREIAEETGIRSLELSRDLFDIDIHEIPARSDTPAHLHYDLRFLARVATDPPAPTHEGLSSRWVSLGELPVISDDESIRRMARKLLDGLPPPAA